MFQLLIRAKQYRNDDSRLISPSELIAVEHSAIWRKWTTLLNDISNLLLQNETWNHGFRTRHVTIIKILSQYPQFHGHDSCIKSKVTVYTHWHQCHFFFHFIIINRISPGHTERAREASWSRDGCNLTLTYSKNGSPRSPSLCSGEREVVCERV